MTKFKKGMIITVPGSIYANKIGKIDRFEYEKNNNKYIVFLRFMEPRNSIYRIYPLYVDLISMSYRPATKQEKKQFHKSYNDYVKDYLKS